MASELILVLRDFFLPEEVAAPADLPRLPALETLLATGSPEPLPQGWRAALASMIGGRELAAVAPAAVVSGAWPGAQARADEPQWLATPVHYFAGLDSVRLHPAGLLQLSAAAQAALVRDFGRVFGEAPWRLQAAGGRELLLSGEVPAAGGEDPAFFLGRDPREGLPRGAGAATLRRLGVEIEMWLHEHPINQERQARGELPVSALWFWGAPDAPARTPLPEVRLGRRRLHGEDPYAEALWRLGGGQSASLPENLEALDEPEAPAHVLLYPTLAEDGLSGALQRLERDWLAPGLAALRGGRLPAIRLLAGRGAHHFRAWHRVRFWRPRHPWARALA